MNILCYSHLTKTAKEMEEVIFMKYSLKETTRDCMKYIYIYNIM